MWTATIQQVSKEGEPKVNVLFTDGTRKIDEDFYIKSLTAETLKRAIEIRRVEIEKSYTFAETLDTAFDLTPSVIPEVKDEVKGKFLADFSYLMRLKPLVDLGIISIDSQEYVDLVAVVKSGFDFKYFH